MSNIVFTDAQVAAKYESLTDIDYHVIQPQSYSGKLSNISYAAAYKMVKCGSNLLKVKDGGSLSELNPVEAATTPVVEPAAAIVSPEVAATPIVVPSVPVVDTTSGDGAATDSSNASTASKKVK